MTPTPKEKAHELVQKFTSITFDILHTDAEFDAAFASGMCTIDNAKECVTILVKEILHEIPMYVGNLNPKWKYWDDVRKEIKPLYE